MDTPPFTPQVPEGTEGEKAKINGPGIIIGVLVVLIIGGLGGAYWNYHKRVGTTVTTPVLQNEKPRPVADFYLFIGGKLTRTASGYAVAENLRPVLLDSVPRELPLGAIDHISNASLYKIEVVYQNGKKDLYNSSVMYSLPGDDLAQRTADEELPINANGFMDDVVLRITPGVQKINYRVGGKIVKTLQREKTGLYITSLDKQPATQRVNDAMEQGFKIFWAVAERGNNSQAFSLEYKTSPTEWQSATAGRVGDTDNIFINPADLRTALDQVDYRLIVTDGFQASVWDEPGFINVVGKKKIDLSLDYGTIQNGSSWTVGQNGSIGLIFSDPETGQGCSAKGCANGHYRVTWTSDKQTICPGDISENEVTYFFKKQGQHTITVTVQRIGNLGLQAEKTLIVFAGPSAYPPHEDKNPGCSS